MDHTNSFIVKICEFGMEQPIPVRELEGSLISLDESKQVFELKDFELVFEDISPHYAITSHFSFLAEYGLEKLKQEMYEFSDPNSWKEKGEKSELAKALDDIRLAGQSDAIGQRQRVFGTFSTAEEFATVLYDPEFRGKDLFTKVYLRKLDLERYGGNKDNPYPGLPEKF